MEFPDLGEQCSLAFCRQLDFLPFKCNACQKVFCKNHSKYDMHSCEQGLSKDKVVPTCPLCSRPVPLPPGESADSVVTKHIDNNCDSEVALMKRKQLKANRCSWKSCKSKDALRIECESCHLKFCLPHRHQMDHKCTGSEAAGKPVSKPGSSAIFRQANSKAAKCSVPQKSCSSSIVSPSPSLTSATRTTVRPTALHVHALQQPSLSEEEALRRAIQMSLQSSSGANVDDEDERIQLEADEALARALQESEMTQRTPVTTASDSNKCVVS